ncbi:MAG: alpha/beta fold hydrolase [Bacteroidia bacterium]|nr:alpha/beta fold hydrolase [Bacteroidia bacterium]
MKLFYRNFGDGTPIVIMHGVFGFSDNWVTVGKRLAEQYAVYLIDLRNHGRSPHSHDLDYSIMAGDLLEFLNDQNLDEAIIVGHSMGGKVAMQLANSYPEKVSKLIVVDIAPRYYEPHYQEIVQGLSSLDLENMEFRKEADEHLAKYIDQPGDRQFLLMNLYRKKDKSFGLRINLQAINDNSENIGAALEMEQVEVPSLFIRGGNSNYITFQDEQEIKHKFSDVEVVTVENSGHWVHAEQPRKFLEVLIEFLDK